MTALSAPPQVVGGPVRPEWIRLAAYETRRALSLRSTAVMIVVTLVAVASPYATARGMVDGVLSPPPDAAAAVLSFSGPTVGLVASVFGGLTLGHEFRYGTGQASLVAMPHRMHFFAGKVVAAAVGGALLAAFALAATWGLMAVTGTSGRLGSVALTAYARPIGLELAFAGGCAVVALCVVALTESQQWGVIAPLVWMNVVEAIIRLGLGDLRTWHAFVTPLSSMRDTLAPAPAISIEGVSIDQLPTWAGPTAFGATIVVLLALAALRFRETDF